MTTICGMRPPVVATLNAIYTFHAEHGRTPSNPELAAVLGIAEGTIAGRLQILQARGWIRTPGCSGRGRRLELTDKKWVLHA